MSTNGDVTIAVQAEGVDEAGETVSGGGGGGDGGGGGGGGGGLTDALKGGIIGGLLSQAIGPLLDVLNPILNALSAFLAPLAVFLLRLFQPVLRLLFNRVLPRWLEFMTIANRGIPAIQGFISRLPGLLVGLPGKIWNALKAGASWLVNGASAIATAVWQAVKSGASWLVNGASAIATAVWQAVKSGASWITDGASAIATAVWDAISSGAEWITTGIVDLVAGIFAPIGDWLTDLKDDLKDTLEDIWDSIKSLPGDIASKLPGFAEGGVVTGPTLATVGEAGPEAIIPLDRLEDVLGRQEGGGTNIQIGGGLAPFVETVTRDPDIDL